MIKYFVSYVVYSKEFEPFFGSSEVKLSGPVVNLEAIEIMGKSLGKYVEEQRNIKKATVIILNWQRFENPQPAEYSEPDVRIAREE